MIEVNEEIVIDPAKSSDFSNGHQDLECQVLSLDPTYYPPERLTMQEQIKLSVEYLFGKNDLEFAYDRLNIHGYIDQQLDTMEDIELLSIYDCIMEKQEKGYVDNVKSYEIGN